MDIAALHCNALVLHRFGAQGAHPDRQGANNKMDILRPSTKRGNTTVKGGDLFTVVADEAATRIGTLELPRSEGAEGTGGSFSGKRV